MKSIIRILLIVFFTSLNSQNNLSMILKSDNINELEIFLQQVHPYHPIRIILKDMLIALTNLACIKTEVESSIDLLLYG